VRPSKQRTLIWSLILLLPIALACQTRTSEQRVNELRGQYSVQSTSFLAQKQLSDASEADAALQEGEEPDGAAEPVANADNETASIEDTVDEEGFAVAEPQPTSILFDVLLSFDGRKPLPGLTLDIVHKDPFDKIKDTRRHFIETANLVKGDVLQQDFVLNDFNFEEGDQFAIEIRSPIAAEEQGEYREFALMAGS
jgi:hypothetical protein